MPLWIHSTVTLFELRTSITHPADEYHHILAYKAFQQAKTVKQTTMTETSYEGRVALITGITGQDGSYLAEFLLKKGYTVRRNFPSSTTVRMTSSLTRRRPCSSNLEL